MSGYKLTTTVFIAGYPRSGTTWFSNLLNSHPHTVYRHEAIGRLYPLLGDSLWRKLKFDGGLSDSDYQRLIQLLASAHVESDKPPFFFKDFRRINLLELQKLVWAAGKASPKLQTLYAKWFTPREGSQFALVLKETRSSANLRSIIAGTRANHVITLIRHPYAVVASHLRGQRAGVMSRSTADGRRHWFRSNGIHRYLKDNSILAEEVAAMSEATFLALRWRVQNQDYIDLSSGPWQFSEIGYETFLADPAKNSISLLKTLGLTNDPQVNQFIEESRATHDRRRKIIPDTSTSYFSVYKNSPVRLDEWKQVLSSEDCASIDRHTVDLVRRFDLRAE